MKGDKLKFVNNGEHRVPVIEGATYIFDPKLSKSKKDRGRKFRLDKFNEHTESAITWQDTRRTSKIDLFKALLYDYLPTNSEVMTIGLVVSDTKCWKCQKSTSIILGVRISCQEYKYDTFMHFPFLMNHISTLTEIISCLESNSVGQIKERYSKTVDTSYLSNGCVHCDAIYGDYFLREETLDYLVTEQLPLPVCSFEMSYHELMEAYGHIFFFEESPEYRLEYFEASEEGDKFSNTNEPLEEVALSIVKDTDNKVKKNPSIAIDGYGYYCLGDFEFLMKINAEQYEICINDQVIGTALSYKEAMQVAKDFVYETNSIF